MPHVRLHDRQIFLDLGGDSGLGHAAPAVGTPIRKWDVRAFVNDGRRPSMGMSAADPPDIRVAKDSPPARPSRRVPPVVSPRGDSRPALSSDAHFHVSAARARAQIPRAPTQSIDLSIQIR